MTNSFYSEPELADLGLKSYGKNVLISRKASLYACEKISLGDNVRIDDFCILSGKITIGNYVHIAAAVLLYGGSAGINIDDYSTISSRGAVYAVSDDYSGETMTNPMIPEKYRGAWEEPVYIGRHVIIGTNCTVLPGVTVSEGTSVGAQSLLNKSTDEWSIYYGSPAKKKSERSRTLLNLCEIFEVEVKNNGK